MDYACVVVVLLVAVVGGSGTAVEDQRQVVGDAQEGDAQSPGLQHQDAPMNARTAAWAVAAYDLLQTVRCEAQKWTTEAACHSAQAVPRRRTRVWVTQAGAGPYVAWLPDGLVGRGGTEGVVLLDPHPAASWAHPVLLVQVDTAPRHHCSGPQTLWLEPGDCLRVGTKERCRNLLEHGGLGGEVARRCETNLPPLVVRQQDYNIFYTGQPQSTPTPPQNTKNNSTLFKKNVMLSDKDSIPSDRSSPLSEGTSTQSNKDSSTLSPIGSTTYDIDPTQSKKFRTLLSEDQSSAEILNSPQNSTPPTIQTTTSQLRQRLLCRDAPGYLPCSVLRPLNETTHLVCDPLGTNRQRCLEPVQTRCRVLEACDQGVVVVGAWRREVSPRHTAATVHAAYRFLTHYGFLKTNIKLFYANGARRDQYPAEGQGVYPASMKLALRYHLRSLCTAPFCTDSLLLYLSGPALPDGTLLLWDHDGDGVAGAGEVYSPRELVSDLTQCVAKQVTVLVDTSFSGQVTRAFAAASTTHTNVQVYAAGGPNEYSWGREFSTHWLHYPHAHTCTARIHQESFNTIQHSAPTHFDGSKGKLQRTIFGAPCDVTPPYTHRELHRRYLGCQNTPAALWIRSHVHPFTRPDPTLITHDTHLPFLN